MSLNVPFISLSDDPNLMYSAMAHPIHIHEYHFQVVKIGWPEYDQKTGLYKSLNKDIRCLLNEHCNSATWSDPSWRDGNLPGMVRDRAVRKDTVMVPAGGYVVIRFKTENPGGASVGLSA